MIFRAGPCHKSPGPPFRAVPERPCLCLFSSAALAAIGGDIGAMLEIFLQAAQALLEARELIYNPPRVESSKGFLLGHQGK